MSSDPAFVQELQEQVRILGNRVISLDQELDQKLAYIKDLRTDAALFNRTRDERNAAVQQAQKSKKELAGEQKRRTEAERLVAALQRELEAKQSLLERLQDEAELSERLSKVEPLLADLLGAIESLKGE